jgi:hypothetical protein
MPAHTRPTSASTHRRVRRVAALTLAVVTAGVVAGVGMTASGASSPPAQPPTASHYEATADPGTLLAQGQAAGRAGSQGLVILDFGRPASVGSATGTDDFSGTFTSFASIISAAESFVDGYFTTAPAHLQLDVVIGTNDSCGPGQPCGTVVCGCNDEPQDFGAWGAQLASSVMQVDAYTNSLKSRSGYTDTVTVMAGDDAEPAFDPEYHNTYDLMAGYAAAVDGYQPAMVDYGSADAGYWSDSQLLQIADGFKPNLAVPEIYTSTDSTAWSSLVSFARANGQTMTVYGVLTTASGNLPQDSYSQLVGTLQPITGQNAIRWSTTITH